MMKVLLAVYPYGSWSGQILWDGQELRASSVRDTKAAGIARVRITTTARLAAGAPSADSQQELDAIASCVIGGTSLRGGSGTALGALIVASLDNGMSRLSVDTVWQMIVKGVILLLAVRLDIATSAKR